MTDKEPQIEPLNPELLAWYQQQDEVIFDVVPHSHLDYAWYRDREASKMREIEAFVKTVKVDKFTLEQMITAKEFVEGGGKHVKQDLLNMIRENRMELIGMYMQPDIFLSPQELRFWNFEFGEKIAQELGGTPPDIEYIPDTFGFDENTPMVLQHADKKAIVFMRGFEHADTMGAMFWWQSPDDSRVLAMPMQGGYSNAGGLTNPGIDQASVSAEEYYAKQVDMASLSVRCLMNRFGPRYKQIDMPHMLLMNGNDFTKPDQGLPQVLDGVQEKIQNDLKIKNFKIRTSSLGRYVDLAMKTVDSDKLQTYHGEMRSGREHYVLRGIDSARMELKQRMHEVETRIHDAGSLISLTMLARNAELIDNNDHETWQLVEAYLRAIEQILPVGSHDTVSGCGSDNAYPLPRSLMTGSFEAANQAARNAMAALSNRLDTYGPYQHKEQKQTFANLLPYDRITLVEIPMQDDLEQAQGLLAYAIDGQDEVSIPVQIIQKVDTRYAICALPMKGMSSTQIRLEPTDGKPFETLSPKTHTFETNDYSLDVLPNGMLDIIDKRSGTHMQGLLFEDQGDRGDEYTFCPTDDENVRTTNNSKATVSIVNDGDVFTELQIDVSLIIPEGLDGPEGTVREVTNQSDHMVDVPISTRVKLMKHNDRIEFATTINNTARDHRLRVRFDTPNAVDTVRTKEPYGMTTRSAVPISGGKDWMEPHPVATSHNQGIVTAGDLALFNKGLPEYEALADDNGTINQVALTLLRSVGYLSRGNLSTRPGWAGPGSATPEAQMIGERTYEYAINFNGQQSAGDVIANSYDYTHKAEHGFAGADINGLLDVQMSRTVEMSTLRPTPDGKAVIVRFSNPDDEPAIITLNGAFQNAIQCDAYGNPLDNARDMHKFELPRGMVSIRLS